MEMRVPDETHTVGVPVEDDEFAIMRIEDLIVVCRYCRTISAADSLIVNNGIVNKNP